MRASRRVDFVPVVQAGAGNRDPAHLHRAQAGHGGERSGASYLGADVLDHRDRLAGRKLVGDRPAGGAGFLAEIPLQSQVVDLDHHPVDLVGQGIAALRLLPEVGQNPLDAPHYPRFLQIYPQPPAGESLEQLVVGLEGGGVDPADAVAEDLQRPPGGYRRVELAQASGAGIAGIGKTRVPLLFALAVEGLEVGEVHVDLPPHFEKRGRVVRQCEGDRGDGLEILCDLLAGGAVSPCGADLQDPLAVNQLDRYPVHLQLAGVIDLLAGGQKTLDPGIEFAHFLFAEGVFQR